MRDHNEEIKDGNKSKEILLQKPIHVKEANRSAGLFYVCVKGFAGACVCDSARQIARKAGFTPAALALDEIAALCLLRWPTRVPIV